jgi:beta-lactamase regulating signal transducer with metallopeptidase domain
MRDFILGYLLNAAWEAPLIAAGVFLLLRFAKLDARERCWAGIGCLALAVVLPAVDPRLASALKPPALPQLVSYAVAPPLPITEPLLAPSAAGPDLAPPPGVTPISAAVPASAASSTEAVTLAPLVGQAMVWLFLAAIALGAGRLALGLAAARRLALRALPIELPAHVLAPMKRLAVTQGRKPPQVRVSPGLSVPAAIGGASPMVLVPADFERHGEEAMIAALLHECAHVVRGDYGLNLACEALALPLIWHPAIHLIKAQVQADREAACDRLASTQMPAQRYATCLVAMAGAMSPAPRLTGAAMQTLFGRGELERRVRALLQAPLGAARERLPRALAIGGPVLAAVVALGLALHVEAAMAQTPPPPTPPARAASPAAPSPNPSIASAPRPPAAVEPADPAAPAARPKHVHEHSVRRWTSEDGETHMVVSDDDHDVSAEDQAQIRADVEAAKAEAAKARAYYHSPEFREKMREASEAATAPAITEARAQAAKAEAYIHGAEFQKKLAEVRAQQRVLVLKRGEIVAQLEKVKQILRDPAVEKAFKQARDAGPEIDRAMAEIDRQIEAADARSRPPVPPAPPAPPPPPAPPAPPPPPAPVYDR